MLSHVHNTHTHTQNTHICVCVCIYVGKETLGALPITRKTREGFPLPPLQFHDKSKNKWRYEN